MNRLLVNQLTNILRGNIGSDDFYPFAYQLMAWVRLSKLGNLPEQLSFNPNDSIRDIKEVTRIFSELAQTKELANAQAFSHVGAAINHVSPGQLLQALELLNASNLKTVWPVDDLIQNISIHSFRGANVIPDELSNLMIALCKIDANDYVYIPFEQSYQLTARVIDVKGIPFIESALAGPAPWLINILSDQNIHIHIGDSIRSPGFLNEGRLEKFVKSIGFPPLNCRYEPTIVENDRFQRFREETSAIAVLATRHILARTQHRAVIAVQNGLLFSPGAERSLRDDLLQKGMIETVIALPSALLPGTTIPFSILVLKLDESCKDILFVDGASESFHSKDGRSRSTLTGWQEIVSICNTRIVSKNSALATCNEVIDNDSQLQVARYCRNEELGVVDALLAKYKTVPLIDLVSFNRPVPLEKDGTVDTVDTVDVYEFGPADFPNYGYATNPGRSVKISETRSVSAKKQFLKSLDIAIAIKGSVGKVAIMPQEVPNDWVVGQSCLAIRILNKNVLDPRVLFTFLKSEAGQLLLKQIVSGAAVPLIQLRELEKIKIPVPTLEEQEQIIVKFEEVARIENDVKKLVTKLASISSSIWSTRSVGNSL